MMAANVLGVILLIGPSAAAADEAKSFSVPFELLKTQHMAVQVKVNGKGPYRLIFDTGAPDSLVSNRIAREASLTPSRNHQPTLPIFGARGQHRIRSLQLGDLEAEDLSTMVLDHPTVAAISGMVGPVDGILGFTFFARYRLTIDYEHKLLTFTPSDYQPPDVIQELMKRLMVQAPKRAAAIVAPGALMGLRARDAGDGDAGVVIEAVLGEGPAAAAGLQASDRLLQLDRRWTDTVADLYLAASRLAPGATVEAVVLRQGKQLVLPVVVRAGL